MSGAQFVSTPARLLLNVCEPKLAQIFSWSIQKLSAHQIQDHIQNPQLKGVLAEVVFDLGSQFFANLRGIEPLQLSRKRQMCAILGSLEEDKPRGDDTVDVLQVDY